MPTTEELQAQLLSEYSPAIDEPTFLAIISDFDLSKPAQLREARFTLDILKESTEAEDTVTFDASGSSRPEGATVNGPENGQCDGDSGSARSAPEWSSNTDDTSLSHGISSLDLEGYEEADGAADTSYIAGLEELDEEGTVQLLAGIFSALKPFDVRWTLKRSKWNINMAIDHLMTESFLEESGGRRRGIEAFSETDLPLRPRKGKWRKRKGRGLDSPLDSPSMDSPSSPLSSKWDTAKEDIEFITTRTGVPSHQVSSLYHNNGGSFRDTIAAIVEGHIALKLELDDPIIHAKTIDLANEFPTVPASKLEAIIQITHPSEVYAHELAKALAPPASSANSTIQLEFRHAPLLLDATAPSSKPKSYNAVRPENVSVEETSAKASRYLQERDTNFQKASALYRKGKSDHLMGGAAAYYSQVGRDADALARGALSEAADARVAAQSSRFELDLHGCNVNDAKRITQEWVRGWWHELGADREVKGGKGAYGGSLKVVTGRGNHSEGRAGKLGPAVGKMLMREGWRIEITPGYIMVHGVVTKR